MFRTAEMNELAARIRVGQRYQKTDGAWVVWEVTEQGPVRDGVRHYRIADVKDRSNVKLISERTLADLKSYRPIASDC
jgi:hypothetical protein